MRACMISEGLTRQNALPMGYCSPRRLLASQRRQSGSESAAHPILWGLKSPACTTCAGNPALACITLHNVHGIGFKVYGFEP